MSFWAEAESGPPRGPGILPVPHRGNPPEREAATHSGAQSGGGRPLCKRRFRALRHDTVNALCGPASLYAKGPPAEMPHAARLLAF